MLCSLCKPPLEHLRFQHFFNLFIYFFYLLYLKQTILCVSAVFGWLVNVIPRKYTFYISTALFAIFGLKMLKDGCSMSPTEGQEEMEEVQIELRNREEQVRVSN